MLPDAVLVWSLVAAVLILPGMFIVLLFLPKGRSREPGLARPSDEGPAVARFWNRLPEDLQ